MIAFEVACFVVAAIGIVYLWCLVWLERRGVARSTSESAVSGPGSAELQNRTIPSADDAIEYYLCPLKRGHYAVRIFTGSGKPIFVRNCRDYSEAETTLHRELVDLGIDPFS